MSMMNELKKALAIPPVTAEFNGKEFAFNIRQVSTQDAQEIEKALTAAGNSSLSLTIFAENVLKAAIAPTDNPEGRIPDEIAHALSRELDFDGDLVRACARACGMKVQHEGLIAVIKNIAQQDANALTAPQPDSQGKKG